MKRLCMSPLGRNALVKKNTNNTSVAVPGSKMLDMKEETMEKLRCDVCGDYLSCPPIMLKPNGKSICGRCPIQPSTVRNEAYENIAVEALFPCRYNKQGCKSKVTLDKSTQHEETCRFHIFHCPASVSTIVCPWIGTRMNVEAHYKEKHPELIAEHPLTRKPDITNDIEKNMLMTVYGVVFLVQVKWDASSAKLWHCVRLLGDQQLANCFNYTVKISSHEDSVVKTRPVMPEGKMSIDESLETDLQSTVKILGDYKDINFELKLSMNELECGKCENLICSTPVFQEEKGFWCFRCVEPVPISPEPGKPCRNKGRGCQYKDADMSNLCRHQDWFCKYRDYTCEICDAKCSKRISPMDHWAHECIVTKVQENDNTAILKIDNLAIGEEKHFVLKAHGVTFRLEVWCYADSIWVWLVSDIVDILDTNKYECSCMVSIGDKAVLQHKLSNVSHQYKPGWGYDWKADIVTNSKVFPNKFENLHKIGVLELIVVKSQNIAL